MKVGLTGGIGSGKTSVCRIFESFGIPVFDADLAAKQLYEQPEIKLWLKENIAEEVITENNTVDKKRLAQIIFNDASKMSLIASKIHPLVAANFDEWAAAQSDKPYVIYEAAILFETGRYKLLDKTILVTAPESIRVQRVIQRDNMSAAEVYERMRKQWDDSQKTSLADFVINNTDWTETVRQTQDIHQTILSEIASH